MEDTRLEVAREIREHFDLVKEFRDGLLKGGEDPQDIAKALSAMTIVIRDVVKVQNSMYNAEKFALLQQRIVNVLKEADPEIANKVIQGFAEDVERLDAEAIQ